MKQIGRDHRNELLKRGDVLTNEALIDWYGTLRPVGSGPLFVLRLACALIEEIAETRGIELSTK